MIKQKLLLLVTTVLFTLFVCETAVRLLTLPSVFTDKPPLKIHFPPRSVFAVDEIIEPGDIELFRNSWHKGILINGEKITYSDLWGIFREDELLGYTIQENAASTNLWWQSNNLGARSDKATSPKKTDSRERLLIFGDSYAQGSRVPQDETIDYYFNNTADHIEAINFGVDGYSMTQAYMRYQSLKNQLEYDRVILMVVPQEDLAREINVSRYAGFGWRSNINLLLQPRFIIENGELKRISSPYVNLKEMVKDNSGDISGKLREHLAKYDSFYDPLWHNPTPIIDSSMIVKLIKRWLHKRRTYSINRNIMKADSEAVQITKKIAANMNAEVEQQGSSFTLAILPTSSNYEFYQKNPYYSKKWDDMVNELCSSGVDCIDLMSEFQGTPAEYLDTGYDKTHFGPKTNRLIAEILAKRILDRKY